MKLADLGKIGLTEGEIKVYSALLELGDCTKTMLAKLSGVSPSNIYDITNRLAVKGMVSKVEKNGVTHFSPANPRHILDFLEDKKKQVDNEMAIANTLIPMLASQFGKMPERVKVEVFQGWEGLKTVFEDMLAECSKGDYNYVFGAGRGEEDAVADRFFTKYSRLREQKGIITNIIFNEELRSRKERISFFLKSKKCNVRFLPHATMAEIMLYRNKAEIIILVKEPLVIRITGDDVAKSFLQYFELLWKQAKK